MKFLKLIKHFMQQVFSRKYLIAVFFILPAFCFPAAWLLFRGKPQAPPAIGYFSENGGTALEFFIKALSAGDKYRIDCFNYSEGKTSASKGDLKAFLVFPENFDQHIQSHEKQIITLISVYPEEYLLTLENDLNRLLENYLELSAYSRKSKKDQEQLNAGYFLSYSDISRHNVADFPGIYKAAVQGASLLMFVIMLQIFYTTRMLNKTQSSSIALRLHSSGITFTVLIVSNLFTSLLISCLQITAAVISVLLIYAEGTGFPVYSIYLFFTPFCLMTAAAGLAVSAASRSRKTAADIALLLAVPTCMLSGCFWSLDNAPAIFRNLAGIFPQYWLADGLRKLQNPGLLKPAVINLLILSGFLLHSVIIYFHIYRQMPDFKKEFTILTKNNNN